MRTDHLSKANDMMHRDDHGPLKETLSQDGYYDAALDAHIVSVPAGACHWTRHYNIAFSTMLGSCISVCAYDLHAKVGGMNHFLLPEAREGEQEAYSRSVRYGSAAIETLLNSLYRKGAAKNGLTVKIFGGGHVLKTVSQDIGEKNIEFTKRFFQRENLRIESEDIGGDVPRRVVFFPLTGKVLIKVLGDKTDLQNVMKSEKAALQQANISQSEDSVELF